MYLPHGLNKSGVGTPLEAYLDDILASVSSVDYLLAVGWLQAHRFLCIEVFTGCDDVKVLVASPAPFRAALATALRRAR